MLKKIAIYPYLFVLYMVLNPIFQNLNKLDPGHGLRSLGVLLAFTATGMFLIYLVFKDWRYAGYLVFLTLLFLFVFGHIYRVLQGWQPSIKETARPALMAIWGLLLLLLGFRKVWRRFGEEKVTLLLNTIMVLALISQFVTAAPGLVKAAGGSPQPANASILPLTGNLNKLDCSNHPDIYYIILDAYGREDILNELYGVDTSPFLGFLKSKGFIIAEQSHANYTQTIFSVSASMNFSYIQPAPAGANWIDYYTKLIVNNRLIKMLKECSYETVAFETGFSFTEDKSADLYLYNEYVLNDFESLLVADTPLELLIDRLNFNPPSYSYQAHRGRILSTFDQLKKIPQSSSPKFVFAHIMSPHPPFLFTADGKYIQPNRSHTIADGDDYPGSWDEYRKGYAGQVQFVDTMVEQVVEAILKGSATPPVIILQGDHGPGGNLNWHSPDRSCLPERTSIFNAYYLPGVSTQQLYPEISPVNSFRVVLNAYFHAGLELLPDDSSFTSHRLPGQVIDITNRRDSWANCPMPDKP